MNDNAVTSWADSLAQWAIPPHIIDQAPQSPWIHPVESFKPHGNLFVDTPSRHRALEVLTSDNASVLDVGCGGGRAAFGLTPPATRVVGVDHQQAMLDVFEAEATWRGVEVHTVLGDWPEVAHMTPECDVVTCHHVFYNVANIAPFVHALHSHAKKRVVVELPLFHPLTHLSDLWKHFWDLDRPTSPTAHDAREVVTSLGYTAHLEVTENPAPPHIVTDGDVEHTRIRLCLPPSRDADIKEFLENHPRPARTVATLWWNSNS
jgi:SAM-dependent methyltransferase